jgi:hypothetical protein
LEIGRRNDDLRSVKSAFDKFVQFGDSANVDEHVMKSKMLLPSVTLLSHSDDINRIGVLWLFVA